MTTVSLVDVLDALEMADDALQSYVSRATGQVVTVTDADLRYAEEDETSETELPEWQREAGEEARQILDSPDWLRLPGKFEIHEWALMEDFGHSLPTTAQRDAIGDAIHGAGAFRNFKHTIRRLGVEPAWYAFRDQALEDIARRWVEDHDLAIDDDRERRGPKRG